MRYVRLSEKTQQTVIQGSQRHVRIAGRSAIVTVGGDRALLAAGAALPFFVSTDHGPVAAIALTALGGNVLAGWLTEWAATRMQTAGWLESTTTLDDLARAIDAAQRSDVALAADVQRFIAETAAFATTFQALDG